MDVIDRTTRAGPFDIADICKRFLNAGVEPIWAGHPEIDITTQHGQNEAAKQAIKAFEDKETIAGRFQSGKIERIEDGKLVHCYLCYGYKWDAERPLAGDEDLRNNWLPDEAGDPSPAAVVRRIYTYLAQGWRSSGDASAVKMSDQLQAEGVPPPSVLKGRRRTSDRWQGKPAQWQFAMILCIVQSTTYKGQRPQRYTQKGATHHGRAGRLPGTYWPRLHL